MDDSAYEEKLISGTTLREMCDLGLQRPSKRFKEGVKSASVHAEMLAVWRRKQQSWESILMLISGCLFRHFNT